MFSFQEVLTACGFTTSSNRTYAMDLNKICHQVVALSKKAGDFLTTEALYFDKKAIEVKGLNDFVSYVDKGAEKLIVEALQQILPEAGFIAEEGTGAPVKNGYNWIIDPLDGTTNFIHGLPLYVVSIALSGPTGELLLGVVNEPNRGECFYAIKGGGAFLNAAPIHVSAATSLSQSLVATGFPYTDFDKSKQYLQVLAQLMQASHGLRRLGAAALDLAYVACGRFDAFFEYNLNAWDVAAGALLVREAGGNASTFQNKDDCIFGREIIAGGAVHQALQTTVYRHFYEQVSID